MPKPSTTLTLEIMKLKFESDGSVTLTGRIAPGMVLEVKPLLLFAEKYHRRLMLELLGCGATENPPDPSPTSTTRSTE